MSGPLDRVHARRVMSFLSGQQLPRQEHSMRRSGHTTDVRVHDFGGKFRPTIGLDLYGRGGTFYPVLFLALDLSSDAPAGRSRWSYRFALPHLTWARASRVRRWGGFRAYRVQNRALRAITA